MKSILNNIYITFLATVLMTGILCGCRKASHNGKLDGQWQIMKIENLLTSEEKAPENRIYICMNLHVVQLSQVGGVVYSGNMQYDKDAGRLSWDFPYNKTEDSVKALNEWGIYTNPVTLSVESVTGSTLVLRTPESIITCRRF